MRDIIKFVLLDHFRLAAPAAILFLAGLLLSLPVVAYRIRVLWWLPLRMLELVRRLFGQRPSSVRIAIVIWLFNSTVMFICMASGVHPLLPGVLAVWTGMDVGIILVRAREGAIIPSAEVGRAGQRQGGLKPPMVLVCSTLVLLLELPCFWYSIAMGISLGREVQQGVSYQSAFEPRALAYLALISPALLVSALAEAAAIGGSTGGQFVGTDRKASQTPDAR